MPTNRSRPTPRAMHLTAAQTAERLLIPERALGLYVTDGLLTAYYQGGELRFLASEVARIQARMRAKAYLAAAGRVTRLRVRAAPLGGLELGSEIPGVSPLITNPPRRWPGRARTRKSA